MTATIRMIKGIGLGALGMYFLDPVHGRRRRAMVRDKLVSASHSTGEAMDKAMRDIQNRAFGLLAELRGLLGEAVPDNILEARVRSRIGFVCSHAHAIDVIVSHGIATIAGDILAAERDQVLSAARSVRGITHVEDQLTPHKIAGDIPALQGGASRRLGRRMDVRQVNWAPATRSLAVAVGGGLFLYGLTQRFPRACVYGTIGSGLLARGLTNLPFRRLFGVGAGRRAVDIQKTINIHAPAERVFDFWSRFENYPRFMSHVREVRGAVNDESQHWVVSGPAGTAIEFDTVVTRFVPNIVLAWKTLPNSVVEHAGIIRFLANPDGSTKMEIRMSYNPIGGAIGHAVATLFGADPKHALDDDLVRFKSLMEEGKTSVAGETVTQEELAAPRGVSA